MYILLDPLESYLEENIHKRAFSNIVYMKFWLRRGIQKQNYTRKNYFKNRVYKNRDLKLIFHANRRFNIHDFRIEAVVSILTEDFWFS